jgi:hypothetical protein
MTTEETEKTKIFKMGRMIGIREVTKMVELKERNAIVGPAKAMAREILNELYRMSIEQQ